MAIIYWMANLNPSAGSFFLSWIIFALVSNTAASFGTLISALAPTPEVAVGLSSKFN